MNEFSPFFHIRTKLIISYVGIILFTILTISVIFFITSKQIISRYMLEQDQFLVEQLSINLTAQLKSMEELQFNQYRYSLLGDHLSNSPASFYDRLNQIRRISECLIGLCYSNSYIESAEVIDNGGNVYSYDILSNYSTINETKIVDPDILLTEYGKPVWSIGEQGKIKMHRLLININTTRTVGQINIVISPRYLTRIYEQDLISMRGHIVIFDKEGFFIPSMNAEINNVAALLFKPEKVKNNMNFSHNGEQYLVSMTKFPKDDFEMFHILSLRDMGIYTRFLLLMTSLAALAAIVATIIVAQVISNRVTDGIEALIKGIKLFAEGDFKSPVQVNSRDEIGYLAVEFNRMADSINHLITNVYEAELNKRKAETNALQFEYSALESKINPHFIYNTLESVNSLAKLRGADDISKIVCLLGNLLRENISSAVEKIPIEKEIENVSKYLQIQKLAYGEKFDIHITIQKETMEAMVPKFILQPLVENALYHGILVSTKHGELFLDSGRQDENLSITVRDNGVGISRKKLLGLLDYSVEQKSETGTHTKVGVKAVDKRLKILYGDKYGLKIESEENKGTTVHLIMPFFIADEEERGLANNVECSSI